MNLAVHHETFKDTLLKFVLTKGDEHVPIFGHGLWYYVFYPLRRCEVNRMVYTSCNNPQYSTSDALALVAYMAIAMVAMSRLLGLHVPFSIRTLVLAYSFLIFRYDYVPRCLPMLPLCLMMDLQYLTQNLLQPCLCQMLPGLIANPERCVQGICGQLTNGVLYKNCPRTDLGVFQAPIFWIRWKTPPVFELLFAHENSPLSWSQRVFPTIKKYVKQVNHGNAPTAAEITCGYIQIFDVLIVFVLLHLLFNVAIPALQTIAESAVSASAAVAVAGGQLSDMGVKIKELEERQNENTSEEMDSSQAQFSETGSFAGDAVAGEQLSDIRQNIERHGQDEEEYTSDEQVSNQTQFGKIQKSGESNIAEELQESDQFGTPVNAKIRLQLSPNHAALAKTSNIGLNEPQVNAQHVSLTPVQGSLRQRQRRQKAGFLV